MHCHAFHNLKMIGMTAAANHIFAKDFPILFKAVVGFAVVLLGNPLDKVCGVLKRTVCSGW
jgi:hypothetical protein